MLNLSKFIRDQIAILVSELDKAMRIYRTHHLVGRDGITGMGRTKFFAALKSGDFPDSNICLRERTENEDGFVTPPIHGWTSDLIEAWIESQRTDRS